MTLHEAIFYSDDGDRQYLVDYDTGYLPMQGYDYETSEELAKLEAAMERQELSAYYVIEKRRCGFCDSYYESEQDRQIMKGIIAAGPKEALDEYLSFYG